MPRCKRCKRILEELATATLCFGCEEEDWEAKQQDKAEHEAMESMRAYGDSIQDWVR